MRFPAAHVDGLILPVSQSIGSWGKVFESGLRAWDGVLLPDAGGRSLREEIAALSARAECGLADDGQLISLAFLHLRNHNPDAALVAVLPLLSRSRPDPHALYIRGLVRLHKARPQGIHDLLAAAGAAPMLMGRAVAHVETWLSGTGSRYDDHRLRGTLAQLRAMYETARKERQAVDGQLVLRPPTVGQEELRMVRNRLRPFTKRIRAAWLARRDCDHFPVWTHHELLLDVPLRECWPVRGMAGRLEKLRQSVRLGLPHLLSTTISVRIFPLLLPHRLRRQIHLAAGAPFLTGREEFGDKVRQSSLPVCLD